MLSHTYDAVDVPSHSNPNCLGSVFAPDARLRSLKSGRRAELGARERLGIRVSHAVAPCRKLAAQVGPRVELDGDVVASVGGGSRVRNFGVLDGQSQAGDGVICTRETIW